MPRYPMVWSDNEAIIWNNFETYYDLDTYDGFVLAPNEPERPDQADMTPEEGKALYERIRAECPNCRIVWGNVSQELSGYEWFVDWLALFDEPPEIAAVGIHHYYFGANDHSNLPEQLDFYASYGWPIWVTELGTHNPDLLADWLELFENTPAVEAVFYFAPIVPEDNPLWPWPQSSLFDEQTGHYTLLGCVYLGDC